MSHNALGRGDAILRHLRVGEIQGAEVGVYKGLLSSYLLSLRPDLKLLLVDRWAVYESGSSYVKSGDSISRHSQMEFDKIYEKAMRVTDFAKDRRQVHRIDSITAAASVADHSLDFVFIDADHSYDGVRSDIAAWLPKLKQGGLLSGHDYSKHPQHRGVCKAVDEIAAHLGLPRTLDIDSTWFIRL